MTDNLPQQTHQSMLDKIKAEKPSAFTVGTHADILNKNADATVTYDRKLRNGLGLTAYLKAWWNDAAVVPSEKRGITLGAEGSVRF